jgi:hypothetical protein
MGMPSTELSYLVGRIVSERGLAQAREELLNELEFMCLPEGIDRVELKTQTAVIVVSRKDFHR